MSAPDPVRCAVIGTKTIAGQHLPVLQTLPEAEVAALCEYRCGGAGGDVAAVRHRANLYERGGLADVGRVRRGCTCW